MLYSIQYPKNYVSWLWNYLYTSLLSESSYFIQKIIWEVRPSGLLCSELFYRVQTQKSAVLIYFMAVTWNHPPDNLSCYALILAACVVLMELPYRHKFWTEQKFIKQDKHGKDSERPHPFQLDHKYVQKRPGTYNLTRKRVRIIIVPVENQLSITCSECVSVALVIQIAKRSMHSVVSPYVACLVVQYFTPYLRNGDEVKERVQLYLYSLSGPSWSDLGRSLPYFL